MLVLKVSPPYSMLKKSIVLYPYDTRKVQLKCEAHLEICCTEYFAGCFFVISVFEFVISLFILCEWSVRYPPSFTPFSNQYILYNTRKPLRYSSFRYLTLGFYLLKKTTSILTLKGT